MERAHRASRAIAIGCAFASAIVAGALLLSASARADISVRIDIGNAPPPPRFVFLSPPHERRYAGDPVYVIDDPRVGDNDCFHYQGYYWVFSDGYWYRAASWRGPFLVFDPRYVPAVFYRQPPRRWKHRPSGPPSFPRRFEDRSDDRSRNVVQKGGSGPPQPLRPSGDRRPQVLSPRGNDAPPADRRNVSRPPADHANGDRGAMQHAKPGGKGPAKPGKKDTRGSDKGTDKGGDHGGK